MNAARPAPISVEIVSCGQERAEEIHRLTQSAFSPHRALDPPSGAGKESVERVAQDLAAGGGAIAEHVGRVVGCLRWQIAPSGDFHVRRVAVDPQLQRCGIGRMLMLWAEHEAARRGCEGVFVGVRTALPTNLEFYRRLGYEVTGEHRHDGYDRTTWLAMRKNVRRDTGW